MRLDRLPCVCGAVLLVGCSLARTAQADPTCSGCTPEWRNDLRPLTGPVHAVAEFNSELYVGGSFYCANTDIYLEDCAGGIRVNGIAKWNEASVSWENLGSGLQFGDGTSGEVYALAVYDGALYVGGDFNRINGANGLRVGNLARWTGTDWEQVHTALNPTQLPGVLGTGDVIKTMLVHDNLLYIGGEFFSATQPPQPPPEQSTIPVRSITSFNGERFSPLDEGLAGPNGAVVNALAVYDNDLFVGGKFSYEPENAANCDPLISGIARWDGTAWSSVGEGIQFPTRAGCAQQPNFRASGSVNALQVYTADPLLGPELYAAGNFELAGGQWANNIAKWNPSNEWSAVNGGVDGQVFSLAVFDDLSPTGPSLYVGGEFTLAHPGPSPDSMQGTTASNIARWDGECWAVIPCSTLQTEGVGSSVYALGSFPAYDPQTLLVAGKFQGGTDGRCNDNTRGITRLEATDADLDGVRDRCDNCPGVYNSGQEDSDGDGVGDACDDCPCGHDKFDSDNDTVPNVCDNCPDNANANQADSDGNGIGDVCDHTSPAPLKLVRIRDLTDTTLESFEYDPANGRLTNRYRGTPAQPILQTNYGYDTGGRLSIITHQPSDNTGQPRTVELKYDPMHPNQVVGTVHGGCGCGNGNQFVYRDDRDRVTQFTTAADDLQDTVVLETFEYMENNGAVNGCGPNETNTGDVNDDGVIDDRMKVHRRRNEAGVLVEVGRRVYDGGPVGPYSVIVCRPSAGQFEVRQEHYDAARRLIQVDGQDALQVSCVDPGSWTATTTYSYTRATDVMGIVTSETWTTEYPSGYKDVTSSSITGTPYQTGSTRVHTAKRVSDASEEINVHIQTYEYNGNLGDYRLKNVTDPNHTGEPSMTYVYDDDPLQPDHVISETRVAPGGISTVDTLTTTFVYDSAGRIERETRPGPNNGPVVEKNTYDQLGRLVSRTDDFGGLNRVSEYRYNAFDEQIASREPGNLVRAKHYNSEGQVDYDYSFEFDGDLDAIGDASQPPVTNVYEHRLYEYHLVSGKTTRERVVLSDSVPFTFNATPPLTADTVSTYDAGTGQWLLTTARAGLEPKTFTYDEQGRNTYTWSEGGIIRWDAYNGRGLVAFSGAQENLFEWALLSQTSYLPDGQVAWTRQPNGSYFVHEYDDFGRLSKKKRCDTSACDGEFHYVTTFEYDSASNVSREYTWDGLTPASAVADTGTNYDKYGRPYSVRRRVTFRENPPAEDDDDDNSDGKADEVTLTKYNAAGGVEVVAGKLSGAPIPYTDRVDQVTRYSYDNLGRLKLTTRVNNDVSGPRFDERIARTYDSTTDRVEAECRDAEVCGTGTLIRTAYQYDPLGRVTKSIDPEGHYVDRAYDSRGNLVRQVGFEAPSFNPRDGVGGTALSQERWKYDNAGRLIQTARMASAAVATSENPQPASDHVIDYTYDQDDRKRTATTFNMNLSAPHTTIYGYDVAMGQEVIDPYGNWERMDSLPPLNIVGERTR